MADKVIDRTPAEWNADEWHLFICQHCDNRATSPNGMNKVALKIADTMDALRLAAKPADEKLREALKPFARAFEALTEDDLATVGVDEMKISDLLFEPDYPTIGDLRKAHEALSGRLP